jgi:hypothetical protein
MFIETESSMAQHRSAAIPIDKSRRRAFPFWNSILYAGPYWHTEQGAMPGFRMSAARFCSRGRAAQIHQFV